MPRDYYEVLGVDRSANKKVLHQAFRKLARQYHPDVSADPKAEEKFKEINEAYATLSDDDKRKAYDIGGRGGVIDRFGPFDLFGLDFAKEIINDLFGADLFPPGRTSTFTPVTHTGVQRSRQSQTRAEQEITLPVNDIPLLAALVDAYRSRIPKIGEWRINLYEQIAEEPGLKRDWMPDSIYRVVARSKAGTKKPELGVLRKVIDWLDPSERENGRYFTNSRGVQKEYSPKNTFFNVRNFRQQDYFPTDSSYPYVPDAFPDYIDELKLLARHIVNNISPGSDLVKNIHSMQIGFRYVSLTKVRGLRTPDTEYRVTHSFGELTVLRIS